MKRLIISALLSILALAQSASAAERYTLVCAENYSHLTNKPVKSPYTTIITIEDDDKLADTNFSPCKTDLIEFRADDDFIFLSCDLRTEDAPTMRFHFLINRHTGEFDTWLDGLRDQRYSGECHKAEEEF